MKLDPDILIHPFRFEDFILRERLIFFGRCGRSNDRVTRSLSADLSCSDAHGPHQGRPEKHFELMKTFEKYH